MELESDSPDDIKEMNAAMCLAMTEVNPSLTATSLFAFGEDKGQPDLTDREHHHVDEFKDLPALKWTPTPIGHSFLEIDISCFKRESQPAPEPQTVEHEDLPAVKVTENHRCEDFEGLIVTPSRICLL